MFYTLADKVQGSFFGDWRMRAVAFDTRRRYLYYSAPADEAAISALLSGPLSSSDDGNNPSTTVSSSSNARGGPSPPSAAARGPADSTRLAGDGTPLSRRQNSSTVSRSSSSGSRRAPDSSTPAKKPPATIGQSGQRLVWNKKIKVTGVVPVATAQVLNAADRRLTENDLYRLAIVGEARPLARGETPPVGPLLCPHAGFADGAARVSVGNDAYVRDPFFLKELYDALRDQFEELEKQKAAAHAEAVAAGRPAPTESTLTITSPRTLNTAGEGGDVGGLALTFTGSVSLSKPTAVSLTLRCRDEREFRRFWYVMQMVLGFDKLIVRPYRGLPPYDPRNMVSFAHIPMAVWHTFKALDKAVFYVFSRGDVLGPATATGGDGGTRPILQGCYLCVSHDMIYFMRSTGNIPRWVRLAEVAEFHYNTTAERPFFAFLTDPPGPDIVFVPLPAVFGSRTLRGFDAAFDVARMRRVMHDTCFASLAIRRVVKLVESTDSSVEAYVRRMGATSISEADSNAPGRGGGGGGAAAVRAGGGRPLRLPQEDTPNGSMSCPLPKEQLAAVWHEVQEDLRARGDLTNRAVIPLHEANAQTLQLSEGQLSSIAARLEEQRERRDDVVGMPLERAQQVPTSAQPAAPRTRHAHTTRRNPPSAAADGSHVGGAMPLTAELLNTPQLTGPYNELRQQQQRQRRGSRRDTPASPSSSSSASAESPSHAPSERSSYLVPGTRYLTKEEWEAGLGAGQQASPKEGTATAGKPASVRHYDANGSPRGRGSGATPGAFRYGPERTVNEIVNESMAAMEQQQQQQQRK